MFNIYRLLISSIRVVLNTIFFPIVIFMLIITIKIVSDFVFYFSKYKIPFIYEKLLYLFNGSIWRGLEIVNKEHFLIFYKYSASLTFLFLFFFYVLGGAKLLIKLLRTGTDIRSTLSRESYIKEKLNNAIINIQNRYKKIYNKDLNLKVKIIDSSIENAIIFNDNLIVVTYALLKKSSKDVIEGVLAHEVGHYHNGDTKFNQLNFINSIVSKNVESGVIINAIMFFISIFTRIPFLGMFFGLFFIFLFFPFLMIIFLFSLISEILSIFEAHISKIQEYKADEFSIKLGYGNGLLDFLYKDLENQENFEQLTSISNMTKSAFKIIYSSHPASHKRIKKMEEIC